MDGIGIIGYITSFQQDIFQSLDLQSQKAVQCNPLLCPLSYILYRPLPNGTSELEVLGNNHDWTITIAFKNIHHQNLEIHILSPANHSPTSSCSCLWRCLRSRTCELMSRYAMRVLLRYYSYATCPALPCPALEAPIFGG